MAGAATSGLNWRVASVAARNALVVIPEEIGKFVQVMAGGAVYQAIAAGTGASCWSVDSPVSTTGGGARLQALTHSFSYLDAAIDIAAQTAAINIGDPLPAGAFVLGVYANILTDWTDGGASTFAADVGIASGDDDRYTPTELNIDGGAAEQAQTVMLPAGGNQLCVTFSGSVNLGTLTGGTMDLTVIYFVPTGTAV